jgi:hypothetical protein
MSADSRAAPELGVGVGLCSLPAEHLGRTKPGALIAHQPATTFSAKFTWRPVAVFLPSLSAKPIGVFASAA